MFTQLHVDDEVIIKKNLPKKGHYFSIGDSSINDYGLTSSHQKYAGMKAKISQVPSGYLGIYRINIDGHNEYWPTEMFSKWKTKK